MTKSTALGRPTNYKEEMCEAALKLFNDGYTQVEVATALGLRYESYQLYQRIYPEFGESIKIGIQLSKSWWMKKARDNVANKSFSFVGWSMQVRNMFAHRTDEQPIHIPALAKAITFTDKCNAIIDALSAGDITPSEAKKVSEVIAIGAKVEEVTELKQRIEELEENLKYREES